MRWAIELLGAEIDIRDAKALFANGKIRVETIDNNIAVLVMDDLDLLTDVTQVREIAKSMLDLVNGALFLHDAARGPLKEGNVREYRNGTWKNHYVLVAETAKIRVKLHAPTLQVSGKPAPEIPPSEQKWLQEATSDDVIADVLSYLRGAEPDWFELYKAFERMRDDINRRLGGQHKQESMGWPTKDKLDYFTESANIHRHSPPKWRELDPATAMKHGDAQAFVRDLARIWLDWRLR